MSTLHFTKMNGAGNDFVLADNRKGELSLSKDQISLICDRHRGIGADGVLLVEASEDGRADYRMRYYNADGGEVEMCGNGARCFARYARRLMESKPDSVSFQTIAGVIRAAFIGDEVRLEMSQPHGLALDQSLEVRGRQLMFSFLNTGVPHAVIFVESWSEIDVLQDGAAVRYHEHFAPQGTNANFVRVLSHGRLKIRTYERGVENETLACGTGVVAAAILYHATSGQPSPIQVEVEGGESMTVGFVRESEQVFTQVTLTGPAEFVFEGQIGL